MKSGVGANYNESSKCRLRGGMRGNMNLKKRIVLISVLPVILLGIITLCLTVTYVKNGMVDEVQGALKGTAAATLAAYDQNSGVYAQAANGDIWKGSYNVSKSEVLVDRIKENSGMEVTFFYGDKRVMTSAIDRDGKRILGSPAGETVVHKVLEGGSEYFSHSVSIDGTLHYGYYIPVYQPNQTDSPIGMIFVGTPKAASDATINHMLRLIVLAVVFVMAVCMIVAFLIASSISRDLKSSIHVLQKVANGSLNTYIPEKQQNRSDEIGELSRATANLSSQIKTTIEKIAQNAQHLVEASYTLGTTAQDTNRTMQEVKNAVNLIADSSDRQAENSMNTSEHMSCIGENISQTSHEVDLLNQIAEEMQLSSQEAVRTIARLRAINEEVETSIDHVQEQTNRTNESVQKIQKATAFITSIAEETDMLSLNANIEAARAGERGRGFAVVAGQIQKLAEQSNQSSQEIEEISDVLREDSEKAVEIMRTMQSVISSQNESMQNTQAIVTQVLEKIDHSIQSIEQIKKSTSRLETSRNEVVDAVGGLSEIAQDNASSTRQTYHATEHVAGAFEQISESAMELRGIADQLVKSIDYFKTE